MNGAERDGVVAGWRDVPRSPFVGVTIAATAIVAGGLVATVNSATPFEHGSWLAAYLVLVGGVAQLALVAGAWWLVGDGAASPRLTVAISSWNVGITVVAVGVLLDVVAGVVAGSAVVLVGLGCFGTVAAGRPAGRFGHGYRLVIAVLGASALIGIALTVVGD